MDTRSLIALGMVLAVVVVGIVRGSLDGVATKDIVIMLGSGIVGAMVPRATARFRSGDSPPGVDGVTSPSGNHGKLTP